MCLLHVLYNVISGLNYLTLPLVLKSAFTTQELDSAFSKQNKAKTW